MLKIRSKIIMIIILHKKLQKNSFLYKRVLYYICLPLNQMKLDQHIFHLGSINNSRNEKHALDSQLLLQAFEPGSLIEVFSLGLCNSSKVYTKSVAIVFH